MIRLNRRNKTLRDPVRRGLVVVLVALCLIPLMFAVAMVTDVGYSYNVQAELQAAADSAALAAAGEMAGAPADQYLPIARSTTDLYVGEHTSLGMGNNLAVDQADVVFGDSTYDSITQRWTFVQDDSSESPYAVKVTVRRDETHNPLVPRFFAKAFGAAEGVQTADAAAMIAPRDIAMVVDLSQSMCFDSMLLHRNSTQINLRDVWVTLNSLDGSPSTRSVGGNSYVFDYELTTPGQSVYAGRTGQTFGSMTEWGTFIFQGAYNQNEVEDDPGMLYLPQRRRSPSGSPGGWTETLGGTGDARYQWLVEDLSNPRSLKSRGHSNNEITNLLKRPSSESSTTYRNRVKVTLGIANWNDDGDDRLENNEVSEVVSEPYAQGASWTTWINDVRNASGLTYLTSFGGASYFRERYGLKSYVNWLMDRQFAKTGPVSGSSGYTPRLEFTVAQPLQSVKDAVLEFSDYLKSVEANDRVGLVVYGTQGAADAYSETNGLTNDYDIVADLPYPHQSGEYGRYTNTGEALLRAFMMVYGPGSRPEAHKVIVFMSDGNTTAFNNFTVMSNPDSQSNANALNGVTSLEEFEALFGGIPSGSIAVGSNGSSNATNGRDETLAIANMLTSSHMGMGDAELNVIGVGAEADMEGLLQPLAASSGGQAYHAMPVLGDPGALPILLREIYRRVGGRRPVSLIAIPPE